MIRQTLRLRAVLRPQTVCVFCQHRSATPLLRASLSTSASHCNSDLTFLERTRRRIWGTDNPPGADDPYTGESRPRHSTSDERIDSYEEDMTPEELEAFARREEKELFQQSVDDAPEHEKYMPSESWDGLEIVGGETQWDQGRIFKGFTPIEKLRDPAQLTVALHRAAVEILASASAGYDIAYLPKPTPGRLINDTTKVVIIPTSDGSTVQLQWPDESVRRRVLQSLSTTKDPIEVYEDADVNQLEIEDETESLHFTQLTASRLDSAWLNTPLSNSSFKLSVFRRFSQLTGIHVPDTLIQSSPNLGAFLSALIERLQKPQTVHQAIAAKGTLLETPNVRVMGRRETPVDSERRLGRWKVIERELRARDLPVLGQS